MNAISIKTPIGTQENDKSTKSLKFIINTTLNNQPEILKPTMKASTNINSQTIQSAASKPSPKAAYKGNNPNSNISLLYKDISEKDNALETLPRLLTDLNSNKYPDEFLSEVKILKEYYEKKIDHLESEKESYKRRVRMEQSLSQFIYNFDLVNEKLCNEIDKMKDSHKKEMLSEKEKFEQKIHELKNLIFNKIIKHRDENIQLIEEGTSLRESLNKLQIKALVDQLVFASDAYDSIYNQNIKLVNTIFDLKQEQNEFKATINLTYKEINRLVSCLKRIKDKIEGKTNDFIYNNEDKELFDNIKEYVNSELKENSMIKITNSDEYSNLIHKSAKLNSRKGTHMTKYKEKSESRKVKNLDLLHNINDFKINLNQNKIDKYHNNNSSITNQFTLFNPLSTVNSNQKEEKNKKPKKKLSSFAINSTSIHYGSNSNSKTHWRFNSKESIFTSFKETANETKKTPFNLKKLLLPGNILEKTMKKNKIYTVYNPAVSVISFFNANK